MSTRAKVTHSGSIEPVEDESSDSQSSSDNVTVSSESSNSISLKGDTIQFGDVEMQKIDVLLILLVINIGVSLYG